MFKNNFYEYGIGSKLFSYIIFSTLILMYIFKIINEFSTTSRWDEAYYVFALALLCILIIKLFWCLINKTPLTKAINLWGAIGLRVTSILLYTAIFIYSITTVLLFITNSYYQFDLDINNKIDYKFFNILIMPFSVIRLIGDVVTTYAHVDVLNVKFFLTKLNKIIFLLILPVLGLLYFLQVHFYNKRHNERTPEIFD